MSGVAPYRRRRSTGLANAHNTSSETVTLHDVDRIPESHRAEFAEVERQMHDSRELELRSLGFQVDAVPRHRATSSGSPHASVRSPETRASLDSRLR